MLITVEELRNEQGRLMGTYRLCLWSGAQTLKMTPLCDCPGGHNTHADAVSCPRVKETLECVVRSLKARSN
jgi:hypothetical protein